MKYKATQLRDMTEKQLLDLENELRDQIREARFASSQGEHTHKVKMMKKAIARILTLRSVDKK